MDKAVSDSIERQLRSAFPAGAFTRVDVLGYGDDPDVEPGESAVRAFIDRAGQPAGSDQDDEQVLQAFEEAHHAGIRELHHAGLLPPVAWVQLIPDTPDRRAPGAVLQDFPSMHLGMRSDAATQAPGFASVRTRLGPADLAMADALITAGIASSRAGVLRWVIGRIRHDPAYAETQERAREIGELKDQLQRIGGLPGQAPSRADQPGAGPRPRLPRGSMPQRPTAS